MFVFHCSTRRPFLLALAALGAFLWAGICHADNPPPPTPAVAWHKLVLKYVLPSDVLRIMHWDAPDHFPTGVTRIYALSDDNALMVQATPDGFTQIQEIIKNLDIAPRPVRLKVQFVRARITDVKAFHPSADQIAKDIAGGLLAALLQQGNMVVLSRTTNITNNTPVSFLFQADVLRPSGKVETVHTDLEISPFPNSDDTITLSVLPTNLDTAPDAPRSAEGTPPSTQAHLQTLRTVRNGEIAVYSDLLRGKETELLVFITPTLLPQDSGAGNESGRKRGMIQGVPKISVAP